MTDKLVHASDTDVSRIIQAQLGLGTRALTDELRLVEDLSADSLDALDLLLAVNERFDLNLPATVLTDIHTVGDLKAQVRVSLAEQGHS